MATSTVIPPSPGSLPAVTPKRAPPASWTRMQRTSEVTKTNVVSGTLPYERNHLLIRTSFGRNSNKQFEFGNPWTRRFKVISIAAVYRIGACDVSHWRSHLIVSLTKMSKRN